MIIFISQSLLRSIITAKLTILSLSNFGLSLVQRAAVNQRGWEVDPNQILINSTWNQESAIPYCIHIRRWKPFCHRCRISSFFGRLHARPFQFLGPSDPARSFPNPPVENTRLDLSLHCMDIPAFATKYSFLPDYQHSHLPYLTQIRTAGFNWPQGPESVLLIWMGKWALSY